ncbi:MAG TPA: hypothetical protein VK995_00340, partial [Oceanipulchritudo sp.]|nr:hypothetical protein [Oceanipulchritudo sp.]
SPYLSPRGQPAGPSRRGLMLGVIRWLLLWLLLVIAICLAGAVVGAVVFPIAGRLLSMELTIPEMILNGLKDGGFLALIWAPGISLVVCIMRAYARKAKTGTKDPKALDMQNKEI